VREALQQLQAQGLVMNHPRRGMFVITLTEEDIQRINSLRILLEAEAIKLCRANLTATQEQRLTAIVEEMETVHLDSYFEASLLDLKFHRSIWACSGNPYLEKKPRFPADGFVRSPGAGLYALHDNVYWPLDHIAPCSRSFAEIPAPA